MASEPYTHIEQDLHPPGDNELPTYDDLANQNGPNSRFGRWRGWIEKRAAERYADITPEDRRLQRQRGWGNSELAPGPQQQLSVPSIVNQPPTPNANQLHIDTQSLTLLDEPPPSLDDESLNAPLPFISRPIEPSHLKINHFGSRFLPHTTTPIRCLLPVLGDKFLFVGHDDGLSVFEMFPQQWTEDGDIVTKGPDEAHCWQMWKGETVYQMSILEMEDNGSGTPQGVVLAIVGPSSDASVKDSEVFKTARMYNLGSLVSLARWTIAQKGVKPLELRSVSTLQAPVSPSKKHRHQGSIARSIKSFIDSPQTQESTTASYHNFLSPTTTVGSSFARGTTTPESGSPPANARQNSDDSTWDVVDDLPLRWATDFVPLAAPGSRLAGASVLCFATWSDEARKGKGTGGQLLAIVTKCNILLYETPKGERAYRFVKEFYTPLQPRSVTFIQQSVSDPVRSPGEAGGRFHSHKRSDSGSSSLKVVNSASSSTPLKYGTHLSLFVVFDKKAGWIRLADSAVGEVELAEDTGPQLPLTGGSSSGLLSTRDSVLSTVNNHGSLRQRARLSFEIRESASRWIPPVRVDLPVPGFPASQITEPVHILSRGKRSHVLPSPLPSRSSSTPIHAFFWKAAPKHLTARVIFSQQDPQGSPPLLQLVAFTDHGLETQEIGLSFLSSSSSKGKGRAAPDELIRAEEDLGGETGFLSVGGNWDRLDQIFGVSAGGLTGLVALDGLGSGGPPLSSAASMYSVDTMDSADIMAFLKREEGIYGWYRKDLEDWRIFWVGGNQTPAPTSPTGNGF